MDETTPDDTYISSTEGEKIKLHDQVLTSGNDMQVINDTLKDLTKLNLEAAYASEKLVNLHVLLMHVLVWDNDLEAMAMSDSAASVEKVLAFDLLCGILDSEIIEVEIFLDSLKNQISDASLKRSSCGNMKELWVIVEGKLQDSEESLKQSQEQVSEIKMQLAKLQRTCSYIKSGSDKCDESAEFREIIELRDISGTPRKQADLKQRHVLRMLEKSLARELDFEKKLSELGQNEEQLKTKLHYTEQVTSRMEEASEVIWGRFLEAENASEVLSGISKELVGRFQILQFNLNGSLQREAELKSKLEDCIGQIKAKDVLLQNLDSCKAEKVKVVSEVLGLREKAKSAEEKLKFLEIELKNSFSSKHESLEQLAELENSMELLKESLYEAESRADNAETKIRELTDSNVELSEEISFLKEADNKNTKKVTSLEKQLRELRIQLQNSKVSSEANHEQQHMLYSAIWDMETLIEDLKSKVSKAESKAERVEEQRLELIETNSVLEKELHFLGERVESLEASLHKANDENQRGAEEINVRNKLMMGMVKQIAAERERIQEKMLALVNENELLRGKLHVSYAQDFNNKELSLPRNDCKVEAPAESLQVGTAQDCNNKELRLPRNDCNVEAPAESLQDELIPEIVPEPSSVSDESSTGSNVDAAGRVQGNLKPVQVSAAVFVLILSLFAVYVWNNRRLFSQWYLG